MQVNVVTVQSGWILQQIARRIVEAGNTNNVARFSLSHGPSYTADINFYCDVQNCFSHKTPKKDIGLFTHVHADDMSTVNPLTFKLDYIFHMCNKYRHMFKDYYNSDNMSLMVPFETPLDMPQKKPVIGIFQRGKYEGKGFDFMHSLFKNYYLLCKKFKWVFVGNDWEPVMERALEMGIDAKCYGDSQVSYPKGYNELYDTIDYLLVPSKWEGGPITILEALSKGIKIISSNVGWAQEYEKFIEMFPAGDMCRLIEILDKKIWDIERRRNSVSLHSYAKCAEQIVWIGKNIK